MGVTSTAGASTLRLAHKSFNQMTRTEKISYLKRQRFHDRSIIRYQRNHGGFTGVEVRWARQSLRIVQRNLHALLTVPVRTVNASGGVISALLCIHRYEGAWDDPNSPYWGGLQMDLNFQATYGPEFVKRWGTADHWPVWAQLQAAVRAVHTRGYTPWPNTARYCGLA